MIKFQKLLLCSMLAGALSAMCPVVGAPTSAPKPGAKPKFNGPLKRAEAIMGKPLTAAQKATIKQAAAQRKRETAPIEARYRATVAKSLGLSVAQYTAKEKALFGAKHKK